MRKYRQDCWFTALTVVISTVIVPVTSVQAVNTHIQTDSSLPSIAGLSIDKTGSNYLYTLSEVNGQASGGNLFFSFSHFNIGNSDTAWFNLNTLDLANVISRVTGGSESVIDGQLKMTNIAGGNVPGFFFINPAGITFGAGASVDVPGSFYVSTASNLNLSDGTQYPVNSSSLSTLSSANPESFGFLGNEAGNLNIGSSETPQTTLAFKPGTDVILAANNIHINNTAINNKDVAQAGLDLHLIATGAEISSIKPDMLPDQATSGELTIQNAILNTSGSGSGRIAVRSGNFSASNSSMTASNNGNISMSENDGINVLVGSEMVFDHTSMSSEARGSGNSGSIDIHTNFLKLIHEGLIRTSTLSEGNAGRIAISANKMEIIGQDNLDDGFFDSNLITGITSLSDYSPGIAKPGNAGDVTVIVHDSLTLKNNTTIHSSTASKGAAGKVTVNAKDLAMDNFSFIRSESLPAIPVGLYNGNIAGDAGDVSVNIDNTLLINHDSKINSFTITTGKVGTVAVSADQAEIANSGEISSVSSIFTTELNKDNLNQQAGNVTVTVEDILKISSFGVIHANTQSQMNAGNVTVNAGQLEMIGGRISSDSSGFFKMNMGNAGNVSVAVKDSLKLIDGARISSSSSNSRGNAGSVTVNAGQLEVIGNLFESKSSIESRTGATGFLRGKMGDGGEVIVTVSGMLKLVDGGNIGTGTQSRGNPGKIEISAGQMEISKGGFIESTSLVFGDNRRNTGGDGHIVVTVADTLKMYDEGSISTDTHTSGKAGEITINTRRLEIIDHAEISSAAAAGSDGETGDIEINVKDDVQLSNKAKISIENAATSINPDVIAGNITINLDGSSLYLDDSSITTESSSGDGGSISIYDSNTVYLHNSQITTSVSGQSGSGGNINIMSSQMIMDTAFIQANTTASSASGGKITIAMPAMIIPSGNFLLVGGNREDKLVPFSGNNVIQAIAPNGESVPPVLGAPQLNLSGILANLTIESFDTNSLSPNMCTVDDNSTLLLTGKGGQRLRARNFLLSTTH
ncbi:MAG: filamentous hemagglutinin N-terminal domain-containing protein [Nitrosomonas sp.]|nr:filamentous hemagglutinin N-terminal domain-containing protein [Nitrosomonas sp.]